MFVLQTMLKQSTASYSRWSHAGLGLLCFLLIWFRLPGLYAAGNFVAEDGWVFFADAFNESFPLVLFKPYAGYFHLLPRLIAELAGGLDFAVQPTAYAVVAGLCSALLLTLWYLPVFRCHLASDGHRAAIVLLLAVCHHAENLSLVLGLHWYLSFALALFALAPLPAGKSAGMMTAGLSVLAAWSSPSTVALVPLLVWRFFRPLNRRHRWWCGFTLLHIACALAFMAWMRVDEPSRVAHASPGELVLATRVIMVRGWLGSTLIGEPLAQALGALSPHVLDALGVGVGCFLMGMVWRLRCRAGSGLGLPGVEVMWGMAAILMLALSLLRSLYVAETAQAVLPRHIRYLTAPSLLLLVLVWSLIYKWATAVPGWRIRFVWGLWLLQFGVLLIGMRKAKHWTREFEHFPWSEQVPAVRQFALPGAESTPASLYVPSDVPYWGPVLKRNGGYQHLPEMGWVTIRGLEQSPETAEAIAWFGRFRVGTSWPWIEHELLGKVEYHGEFEGRVWFRDEVGLLYFSSPLMFPQFWVMDGLQFSLAIPDASESLAQP